MMPTHHDLKCLTSSWLVTLPPLASMNWRTASSENSVGRPDMVAVVVRSKQTRRKLNLTEFLWTKKSHYGAKKLFLFHFLSKKIVWKTFNVRMEKKNWWFGEKCDSWSVLDFEFSSALWTHGCVKRIRDSCNREKESWSGKKLDTLLLAFSGTQGNCL